MHPDAPDTQALSREDVSRLMLRATIASVIVALLLIAAKGAAWHLSGAVSLLATLVDSCLDAVASMVNFLAVRHALSPADREHRFGHGKAEALSGLGQALLITGSAGYLVFEAWRALQDPIAPAHAGTGVAVMVLSMALTGVLVLYQRHVVRLTGSTAVGADSLHYRMDFLANASVIAALLLANWGWAGIDPLFGAGIAVYILFSARDIIRRSVDHLMDRELPDRQRERIKGIVLSHPEVHGLHDLRTRRSGADIFLQLHLELEDELSLVEAHRISDEVEALLRDAFPRAQILLHSDPLSIVEAEA